MFDYGSSSANQAAYGSPYPPDIGAQYGLMKGEVEVDLVAGLRDGIIPPECTRCHYDKLKEAGVKVGRA